MKYIDINQKFTAKVAAYIAEGYTINTATMGGSQGEIAHVDLTDGKQVVRFLLDRFSDFDGFDRTEGLEIVVGVPTDKVTPNASENHQTIWNNRLDVIYRERFYSLSGYRSDEPYYGTKEQAERASAIRFERYKARSVEQTKIDLTDRFLPLAVNIIKKRTGKSRVSKADVRICKNGNRYYVNYRNSSYQLH